MEDRSFCNTYRFKCPFYECKEEIFLKLLLWVNKFGCYSFVFQLLLCVLVVATVGARHFSRNIAHREMQKVLREKSGISLKMRGKKNTIHVTFTIMV